MGAYFLENLMDSSWNDSSVFEIRGGSIHSESFSSTSLSIAHDGSVIAIDDRLDNILRAVGKDVFLRGVMHYLVEFKLP